MDDLERFKQLRAAVHTRKLEDAEIDWLIELGRKSSTSRRIAIWMSIYAPDPPHTMTGCGVVDLVRRAATRFSPLVLEAISVGVDQMAIVSDSFFLCPRETYPNNRCE